MICRPALVLLGSLLALSRAPSRWDSSAPQQQEAKQTETIEDLARRLETASRKERGELFARLAGQLEHDPAAHEGLEHALEARFGRAIQGLTRAKVRGSLEALIGRRRALDGARAHALELILDQERFFYPFAVPEVDADRARLYNEVRADVLERIERVRAIWTEKTRILVPAPMRDAWEELEWLRPRASQLGIDLAPPADVPAWLVAQNARLEAITVREIALDLEEGIALDRDRAILARNEALWAAQPGKGPAVPSLLEREEIRLANEYRRMMGRRALAWNPKLQEAARTHAEYMAETGEFGHTESTPGRKDPFARMEAFGYEQGVSENCFYGTLVPLAAHDAWLRSSVHHRNLLDTRATEMASGLSGTFWTQDYGSDREFEQDLGRW